VNVPPPKGVRFDLAEISDPSIQVAENAETEEDRPDPKFYQPTMANIVEDHLHVALEQC